MFFMCHRFYALYVHTASSPTRPHFTFDAGGALGLLLTVFVFFSLGLLFPDLRLRPPLRFEIFSCTSLRGIFGYAASGSVPHTALSTSIFLQYLHGVVQRTESSPRDPRTVFLTT